MTDLPVLVAGAGAAGLAAAIAAADAGAEVLLVERSPHFRQASNTAMSTAMIPAAGSRWQSEAGVTDSPGTFLADMVRASDGTADTRVSAALTTVAPELVDWLADSCGVPLTLATDFTYPGHAAMRCHTVHNRSGRTLLKHLLDAVELRPNITLICPMVLTAVAETGSGIEATLTTPDGESDIAEVSSVVLATNGYGASKELVARHIPAMADAYYHGSDGSTGDALRLGGELGADTADLDAFQGHGSLAVPHAILLTWAVMSHGGIMVNRGGRRFADESGSYSSFAQKVIGQPDRTGWVVFDERIGGLCESFADYQDILAAKAVHRAETAEGLAAFIECDAATVAEELHRVEQFRRGAAADPIGRTAFGGGITAPYLVVRVTGALFHTQGGLAVDGDARVLRKREPIAGLYAAGGAAVGASGRGAAGYLAGNGLLAALGLGYLAGRHAGDRAVQ